MRFLFLSLIIVFNTIAWADHADDTIRLATTTSVESSGLLSYLLPKFKQAHSHYQVDVSVVGSGRALRMARTGSADLVWVHSPKSEQKFINDGYAERRYLVMRNDFVVAGPASDPSAISGSVDVFEALRKISETEGLFVSRADDSGTNKKELSLWQEASIDTYLKDWYIESGVGQAAALRLAEKKGAYLLIDRATLTVRKSDNFKVLVEDRANLQNNYNLIAVSPTKVETVNYSGAKVLIDWLISEAGQTAIGTFTHDGVALYQPSTN